MDLLKYLMISILLASSFTGCDPKPDPKVVIEYRYVHPEVKPLAKPKWVPYKMNMINFNGDDYYFMSKQDGNIMLTNWLIYKDWAEGNFKILRTLENNTSSNENNTTLIKMEK